MQVLTILNGRKYTYKFNGSFYTWVDEKDLATPVIIHTKLREKALSEGADESIFLSTPKPPNSEKIKEESEAKKEIVSKKKTSLNGGFNPFAVGG